MRVVFAIIALCLFLLLNYFTDLTTWEAASLGFFCYFFLKFLYDLGKKLVIFDLSILMAFFTWMAMPVVFYHFYTSQDLLAKLWVRYMPIPSDEYFSFVLPATLMMAIGFKLPLGKIRINTDPQLYVSNLKKELKGKSFIGFTLLGIGLFSNLIGFFVPAVLAHILYLLQHLSYVGIFYIYFSDVRNKKRVLLLMVGLTFASALITGMFGEFIFIMVLSLILISLEAKMSFSFKFLVSVAGIFLILLIQTVKQDYRKRTWLEGTGADPAYFAELVGHTIANPSVMFMKTRLFVTASRMNQGWLVAKTMYHVPADKPFANGETIWKSLAASIVPRFLWPDKPEAGGKFNLLRFWGYKLRGYSMNIGPIGEAYGNFGRFGGTIFMFFYGLFFNFILSVLLKKSEARPTLICWMPFLFLYAVGVETDILTTVNSLMKAIMFTIAVFWVFRFFKVKL